MENELLTPRLIYMLLAHGGMEKDNTVSFISSVTHYTLTHFWWAFLSECLPDSVLSPYFETKQKRNRALSNLMNRSVPHSMPVKLYQALEEHLSVQEMVLLVGWMVTALNQDVHPQRIHDALNVMEEAVFPKDSEAEKLACFFRGLRPRAKSADDHDLKLLRLQAALRVSFLGLHALCGDRMNDSAALKVLRLSRVCHMSELWSMVSEVSPRINGRDFSHVHAAMLAQEKKDRAEPLPGDRLLAQTETLFRQALPPEKIRNEHADDTAGWYIVANWTDLTISVNTYPRPSYDGGVKLGDLENGTLVYVLSAPGYRGLHVSANVWGKILWQGRLAYIPMNLMVKLQTEDKKRFDI